MKRIAEFYKVSFEQFSKDYKALVGEIDDATLVEMYNNIKLPQRATTTSAGYDFYLPFAIKLKANEQMMIPTGIRAFMKDDYALLIMPKSGLGTKNRLQLNNTIGLIDSDYYYINNEGHILTKIIHDNRDDKAATLELPAGKSYIQGVFIKFGITRSDKVTTKRSGGFGSTK